MTDAHKAALIRAAAARHKERAKTVEQTATALQREQKALVDEKAAALAEEKRAARKKKEEEKKSKRESEQLEYAREHKIADVAVLFKAAKRSEEAKRESPKGSNKGKEEL
jgi:hypothetical protein